VSTGEAATGAGTDAAEEPRKRERGTITFPYVDLDDAVSIARAVWETSGLRAQTDTILPRTPHRTLTSGAFRNKVTAARMFGLVTTNGMDIALTDLGRRIVDQSTEAQARAEAFLRVDLFNRLYQAHRGSPLPNAAGIEHEMRDHGVTPNQLERARQVFARSARQAGFFNAAADRLVAPTVGPIQQGPDQAPEQGAAQMPPAERAEPRRVDRARHPLIEGLFTMLPAGGPFSPTQQRRWLEAAKVNLALVYGGDPEPDEEEYQPRVDRFPPKRGEDGS
jgi:hypothetical protein